MKILRWSLYLINLEAQLFSGECCEFFQNTYSEEHLQTTASEVSGEIAFASISSFYVKCKETLGTRQWNQRLNLLLLSVIRFSDFCEKIKYIIHYKQKETKCFIWLGRCLLNGIRKIPTHVFNYFHPSFKMFLFFHYCHGYHWYYLKDCLVILFVKSAEVRNSEIDVSKKL